VVFLIEAGAEKLNNLYSLHTGEHTHTHTHTHTRASIMKLINERTRYSSVKLTENVLGGHVAHIGEMRNLFNVLVIKCKGKLRPLRPRHGVEVLY
jgi:hypothetical protein